MTHNELMLLSLSLELNILYITLYSLSVHPAKFIRVWSVYKLLFRSMMV